MQNAFLNGALVDCAFDLVAPAVKHLLSNRHLAKRDVMVVWVLNPTDGGGLGMRTFGTLPPAQWKNAYGELALRKAQLSHREKKNTATVVFQEPHLLRQGDPIYQGGVFFHGIAVGASGVQSYFDEMVASMVAAAIRGLCAHELAQRPESDGAFL